MTEQEKIEAVIEECRNLKASRELREILVIGLFEKTKQEIEKGNIKSSSFLTLKMMGVE